MSRLLSDISSRAVQFVSVAGLFSRQLAVRGLTGAVHVPEALPVVLPEAEETTARPALRAQGWYGIVGKRVLDLVIVVLGAPVWVPLFVLLAALLLLVQGRPLLHRSARIGVEGQEILVLKFRTMRNGADTHLAALLAADPVLAEEFHQTYKLRSDPRVTFLGNLLRHSSLDELPQLVNVLRGNMSLVGPRPVLREEIKEFYADVADSMLQFRPGLTGPWQVSGRSLLDYERRVALDVEYCCRCSLKTDLLILAKTVPAVFRGHGAY